MTTGLGSGLLTTACRWSLTTGSTVDDETLTDIGLRIIYITKQHSFHSFYKVNATSGCDYIAEKNILNFYSKVFHSIQYDTIRYVIFRPIVRLKTDMVSLIYRTVT